MIYAETEGEPRMSVVPVRSADLIGAITANVYILLIITMCTARLLGRPQLGHWLGLISMSVVIPLIYLFFAARSTNRPAIYFVWLGLMIAFQFVELILDYIFELDFRSVRWAVIAYVMLFFGATGGMVGLAAQAGRWWVWVTGFTFLIMAALAFIQRAKTGL